MKQINKAQARKLYGKVELFISAANMRPEAGLLVNDQTAREWPEFDKFINAFTYYNCDHERGYYPKYYILE